MKNCRLLPALVGLSCLLLLPACDSAVRDDLDYLQKQIDELSAKVAQLNESVISFQLIVNKVQEGGYITGMESIVKDGVQGYRLTFNDGTSMEILNGKDGAPGETGRVPNVAAALGDDGRWYWTLDGEWITDGAGHRLPVSGLDGITPKLKIQDDYWYVSYDNGASWTKLGKAVGEKGPDGNPGEPGKNGDAFFKQVTQDSEYVYLTLADGQVYSIPRQQQFAISLSSKSLSVSSGASYTVTYNITSNVSNWKVSVLAQDGYTAYLTVKDGKSGTVHITAPDYFTSTQTQILLFCDDGKGHAYMSTITCTKK